jgi:hypothetical protein
MTTRLKLGLILDPEFYILERSVSAVTLPLIRAMTKRFDTSVAYDQSSYDRISKQADFLVSLEPKWAAPVLNWGRNGLFKRALPDCPCYVMMSDPHIEQWREDYFLRERLDFILALYLAPTLRHFRRVPTGKIVHFPWSIPDEWIPGDAIRYSGQKEIAIFGAAQGDAYTLRNWCRTQRGVKSFPNSGVENKLLADAEFFRWLSQFDAMVAAGSESPQYRLTTPKYFETAAVGSLLFAQETDDLNALGFEDAQNCVVFTQHTFTGKAEAYLASPGDSSWLRIRSAGKDLIRARHTVARRLDGLEEHVRSWKGRR